MNINHITQSLFKENYQGAKPLELRDGQIVYGKINKLFPHQMAEVQIGSQKMIANLSIPLSLDKQYWFQVKNTNEKPILKVLAEPRESDKVSVTNLLKPLSLPETKENKALIQSLLTNQLPLTKEIISKASEWLTNDSSLKQDLATIRLMLDRNLPFTSDVFHSLSSVQSTKGITNLLTFLQQELSENRLAQPELVNLLSEITEEQTMLENGKPTVDILKEAIQRIGYTYENKLTDDILTQEDLMARKEILKPLLLDLIKNDVPASIKEIASQVIDKITGYQLLSQQVGPMMQIITEIPIRFFNQQVDVTMQYNGRKKEDGTVDSDYCRILFYLELAHLKETVIDMHVQNRVMSITVQNDLAVQIAPLIDNYKEGLKKNLKEANYTLLSILTKPLTKQPEVETKKYGNASLAMGAYKGVDLKI